MTRAGRQRGFTLIEVLMAVVLLSTMALALSRTLIASQRARAASERWMQATRLAAECGDQDFVAARRKVSEYVGASLVADGSARRGGDGEMCAGDGGVCLRAGHRSVDVAAAGLSVGARCNQRDDCRECHECQGTQDSRDHWWD